MLGLFSASEYAYGLAQLHNLQERVSADAAQPMSAGQLALLRQGRVALDDQTDVTNGFGYDAYVLRERGYLMDEGSVFVLTDAGRAAREADRIASLSEIGVYEIAC